MTTKLFDLDEVRRNAILNASLKEFALKGFDAASTNVIAKEAVISKPLLFHYVSSKKELFLLVYDYFSELLNKEYYHQLNYNDTDIFNRLRQSYILQIKLVNKYPWILEFDKLLHITNSDEINKEIKMRTDSQHSKCFPELFDQIDEKKFREGLEINKCKQIIFWSNIGFINQLLNDIREEEIKVINSDLLIKQLDEYLDDLRNIFYA